MVGFVFPATISGCLLQVAYLANVVPWLSWLGGLPDWLVAVIQGFLPSAMLTLITSMVPPTVRMLAHLQGLHSRQAIETSVQVYYFVFLFIQVFLVVSLSTSIATLIEQLSSTIELVPTLLAMNIPKASNYFFSYIIIYTLGTIIVSLMNIGSLISVGIVSPLFDRSPRQKWNRQKALSLKRWGTFLPGFTNVVCIGVYLPLSSIDANI